MSRFRNAPRHLALLLAGALCGAAVERAAADQPHMQSALAHLKAAYAELEQASADKGGYRAKALRQVGKAMESVQAGIAFDRAH